MQEVNEEDLADLALAVDATEETQGRGEVYRWVEEAFVRLETTGTWDEIRWEGEVEDATLDGVITAAESVVIESRLPFDPATPAQADRAERIALLDALKSIAADNAEIEGVLGEQAAPTPRAEAPGGRGVPSAP